MSSSRSPSRRRRRSPHARPPERRHEALISSFSDATTPATAAAPPQLLAALLHAIKAGNADAVTQFVAAGAPLNNRGSSAPLLLAATRESLHVVKVLVRGGASITATSDTGETALHVAVRRGHARIAAYLLTAGATLTSTTSRGDTLLHVAAWRGHIDTVQLLLERGAPVDTMNANGDTPLHGAVVKSNNAIVQTLLLAGASTQIRNPHGELPLHTAAHKGNTALARLLLGHDAELRDATDLRGCTPLLVAAKRGHTDVVELLLDAGASVHCTDTAGLQPLLAAALNGHAAVVALLLTAGASADAATASNATALHLAASGGHVAVAHVLLTHSAVAVDARNAFGDTALHCAANKSECDVAALLLARGASTMACNAQGATPLHHAAFQGAAALVQLLLENGASVHVALPSTGHTPLFLAVKSGDCASVRLLLDAGAAVNVVDATYETPLLWAARTGRVDAMTLLLAHGASVVAAAPSAKSALFAAVANNHVDAVELLLAHGASVMQRNQHGEAPIHIAAFKGDAAVVALLLTHNAPLTAKNAHGETALHLAAFKGDVSLAELLLANGASLSTKNAHGDIALNVAAARGHVAVLQLLLTHNSPMSRKNVHGETALHAAAATGAREIVEVLLAAGVASDVRSRRDRTPLFFAARGGHVEIVELLLAHGAAVDAMSTDAETPLVAAARKGHFDVVTLLLARGASVRVCVASGDTPLSFAAQWARLDVVEMLVENDCRNSGDAVVADNSSMSLVAATLETIRSRFATADVFHLLYALVLQRLEHVWTHIEHCDSVATATPSHVLTLAKVLFRFCQLLDKHASANVLESLLASRVVTSGIRDFHQEIDHLVSSLGDEVVTSASVHSSWLEHWDASRMHQLALFQAALDADDIGSDDVHSEASDVEALTLLQYELASHGHECNDDKRALLTALLERIAQRVTHVVPPVPSWFVARHEVEIRALLTDATRTYSGSWLNADVAVYYDTSVRTPIQFERDATEWHQLSHPHVLKLYGACHIGRPRLFVAEQAALGSLREYLDRADHRASHVWTRLSEVALGVQYLHERHVVHGRLRGDTIFVGADGLARVAGFERVETQRAGHTPATREAYTCRWVAPECVRGEAATPASDVYALGMCICEAVSGDVPWSAESDATVFVVARRGWPHIRPAAMTRQQWDVVKQMFAFDPRKRVAIGYVVEHLKRFAAAERSTSSASNTAPCDNDEAAADAARRQQKQQQQSLDSYLVPELGATIPQALERVLAQCQRVTDTQDMALHVHARLATLFAQLEQLAKRPADVEVARYCTLLERFQRYVRTPTSDGSATRMAQSLRAADAGHTFDSEIDRLLEILGVRTNDVDPVHAWRVAEATAATPISSSSPATSMTSSLSSCSIESSHSSRSIDQSSCTSNCATSDDTKSCRSLTQDAAADVDSVQPPPWFLPLHELVFDATDRIGEGSFGAVYRGAWLDTPVVVKFMGYDDDGDARAHDLFVHEASVWHTLNHPHVVKLFGACHIGKRFFACEYAPHGTLRQYLRQCVDAIGINSSGIAANGINSSGTHINGVNADDINTSGSNAIGIVANGVNSSDTNTSIRPPSVDTNTSKHTALVWRKLYEVALGLQYLHDQGVVHNDLKCDNLLVGADHKAKITDFGLSCTAERTIQLSLHEMGALQWKAPEVLRGEAPSRASDVYGFAMCIVEAVRGDAPYGRMADVMVRLQVRKGHLPSRPAGVCDEQWSVVEMMSATDPARRVRIAFVVDKLKDISEQLALQMEVEQQVQYQVQQVQCLQDDACDSQPVHDTAVGAAAAVCSADAVAGVADSGPAPIVACDANETDTSNKSEKVEGAAAVELLQP